MIDTRDTLLRTLVLAQRTADTAVAEAHSEAKAITDAAQERAARTVWEAEAAANARMRSAEERAAQVMAEGEENCRLIIAETKRTAAIEIASERERWHHELQGLATEKADLEATSARIRGRLEDERERLHNLMASFRAFVEEIDPGQVTSLPETPAAEAFWQEQPLDPIPLLAEADPPAHSHGQEEAVVVASQPEPEPQATEPQATEPQATEPQATAPSHRTRTRAPSHRTRTRAPSHRTRTRAPSPTEPFRRLRSCARGAHGEVARRPGTALRHRWPAAARCHDCCRTTTPGRPGEPTGHGVATRPYRGSRVRCHPVMAGAQC